MNGSDDPIDEARPWYVSEARRFALFMVFIIALGAAGLGMFASSSIALLSGLAGYILVTLLHVLWGERTRPQNAPMWWLLGALVAIPLVMGTFAVVPSPEWLVVPPIAVAVALFFRHDQNLTPTLMLGGVVWSALFMHGRIYAVPADLGESEAIWIAFAVLIGVIAATIEHDRLQRRKDAGTPPSWTVLRLAFVAVWTLVVFTLREDVQWGRIFVLLGADLSGRAGQMLLIGIIVVAIVAAAFAFQKRKEAPKE